MVSFTHESLYRLYLLAVGRGLRVASTLDRRLKVSSASKPWLPLEDWYDVFVADGFYSCACQEPYPKAKACSHGSLASVAVFPSLLTGWLLAECARIREEWRRKDDEARRAHLPRGKKLERIKADIVRLDKVAREVWGDGVSRKERKAA